MTTFAAQTCGSCHLLDRAPLVHPTTRPCPPGVHALLHPLSLLSRRQKHSPLSWVQGHIWHELREQEQMGCCGLLLQQVADGVQGPPGGSGRRAGGNAAAIAAVGASGDVQPGAATWRVGGLL